MFEEFGDVTAVTILSPFWPGFDVSLAQYGGEGGGFAFMHWE